MPSGSVRQRHPLLSPPKLGRVSATKVLDLTPERVVYLTKHEHDYGNDHGLFDGGGTAYTGQGVAEGVGGVPWEEGVHEEEDAGVPCKAIR